MTINGIVDEYKVSNKGNIDANSFVRFVNDKFSTTETINGETEEIEKYALSIAKAENRYTLESVSKKKGNIGQTISVIHPNKYIGEEIDEYPIATGVNLDKNDYAEIVPVIINQLGHNEYINTLYPVESLEDADGIVGDAGTDPDTVKLLNATSLLNKKIISSKTQSNNIITSGDLVQLYSDTIGTSVETELYSNSLTYASFVRINKYQLIFTYSTETYIYAAVIYITDTAIYCSSSTIISTGAGTYIKPIKMSDNTIVVTFVQNNNACYSVLSISDEGDITVIRNNSLITSNSPSLLEGARLTNDKFIISYKNGSTNYGESVCVNINTNTIGNIVPFTSTSVNYLHITRINRFLVIVSYSDTGNNNYCTVNTLSINGKEIAVGTKYTNSIACTNNNVVTAIEKNKILVFCQTGNTTSRTFTLLIDDSTKELSLISNSDIFTTGIMINPSVVKLNNTHIMVAYTDNTNNVSKCMIIGLNSNGYGNLVSEYTFCDISVSNVSVELVYEGTVLITYIRDSRQKGILVGYDSEYNMGTTVYDTFATNVIPRTYIGEYIESRFDDVSDKTIFSNAIGYTISAVKLSDTKVLVGYADGNNNNYGTLVILTINNDNITANTSLVFNSSNTNDISVFKLSDNTAMVVYVNSYGTSRGTAKILTISNNTIAASNEVIFTNTSYYTSHMTARMINNNKIIVLYQRDNGGGYCGIAVILTIVGDSITVGTPMTFNNAISQDMSGAVLSDSSVLIVYRNGSNNSGIAQLLSINDTTITSNGNPAVFSSTATIDAHISTVLISNNRALVAYYDGSTNGTAVILNIDNSSISVGNRYTFETGDSYNISASALYDNTVLLIYKDGNNNSYGTALLLNVDNEGNITVIDTVVFNNANSENSAISVLSNTKALIVYKDASNAYGAANIINIIGGYYNETRSYSIHGVALEDSFELITPTQDIEEIEGRGIYTSSYLNSKYAFRLNDNKILVVLQSSNVLAYIITIFNSNITIGNEYIINSGSIDHISLIKLSNTKVLAIYQDYANNGYGTAQILTISGDTITTGTKVVFKNANTSGITSVGLSDTRVLLTYNIGASMIAQILTISGDTITIGTEVVFNNIISIGTPPPLIKLSDNKVLSIYQRSSMGYGTAQILTISGDTITAGTEVVFNNSDTSNITSIMLSDTRVLVAYRDGSNTYGTAQILTISGDTITARAKVIFNSASTSNISIIMASNTKILITYCHGGNNYSGTTQILTISGDTIIVDNNTYNTNTPTNNNIHSVKVNDSMIGLLYGLDCGYFSLLSIGEPYYKNKDRFEVQTV